MSSMSSIRQPPRRLGCSLFSFKLTCLKNRSKQLHSKTSGHVSEELVTCSKFNVHSTVEVTTKAKCNLSYRKRKSNSFLMPHQYPPPPPIKFLAHRAKQRAEGLSKIWSWWGPLLCWLPWSDMCFATWVAHQWPLAHNGERIWARYYWQKTTV